MVGDPKALTNVVKAMQRRTELRARGDILLADAIREARSSGWSLRDIGDALGISHVMVQKHLDRTP